MLKRPCAMDAVEEARAHVDVGMSEDAAEGSSGARAEQRRSRKFRRNFDAFTMHLDRKSLKILISDHGHCSVERSYAFLFRTEPSTSCALDAVDSNAAIRSTPPGSIVSRGCTDVRIALRSACEHWDMSEISPWTTNFGEILARWLCAPANFESNFAKSWAGPMHMYRVKSPAKFIHNRESGITPEHCDPRDLGRVHAVLRTGKFWDSMHLGLADQKGGGPRSWSTSTCRSERFVATAVRARGTWYSRVVSNMQVFTVRLLSMQAVTRM